MCPLYRGCPLVGGSIIDRRLHCIYMTWLCMLQWVYSCNLCHWLCFLSCNIQQSSLKSAFFKQPSQKATTAKTPTPPPDNEHSIAAAANDRDKPTPEGGEAMDEETNDHVTVSIDHVTHNGAVVESVRQKSRQKLADLAFKPGSEPWLVLLYDNWFLFSYSALLPGAYEPPKGRKRASNYVADVIGEAAHNMLPLLQCDSISDISLCACSIE